MLLFSTTLLLVLSFTLTGCISSKVAERPESWSKIDQVGSDNCPDISGTYLNVGQSSDANACEIAGNGEIDSACVLSVLLSLPVNNLPSRIPATDLLNTKINIGKMQSTGLIPIKLYKHDQIIQEFILDDGSGHLVCKDGAIFRSLTGSPSLYYGVAVYGGGQYFRPSSDGSILLEFDAKYGGAFLIIPIAGHTKKWYRWKNIEENQ